MNNYQKDPADGHPYVPPFLPKRMPGATQKELEDATYRLREYLKVMRQMYIDLDKSGKLPEVMKKLREAEIERCQDPMTIGYRRWLVGEEVLGDRRPTVVRLMVMD